MNSFENFIVKDPTIFSDHSQLICWVTISPKSSPQNISHPRVNMSSLPKQCEVFLDALKQEEFVSRISSFENTSFPEDSEGVNLATEQFTSIINDACLRSLRLAHTKKNPLRKQLNSLSNKKHKNPLHPHLRHQYHTMRKNFKKLINYKKNNLLNSQIEDLTQNKDNQKFWSYLKSLKGNDQNATSYNQDIPVDNLFKHFKQLHSHPDLSTLPRSEISFKVDLSTLEQTKDIHNVLDSPISLEEIKNMVKLLKSKKAPGPDKIRNEMLKTGIQFLSTALYKLFNLILHSGFFPKSWCEGIITPIYKSGNKHDPANYRGICINSCLGKLFTSVLNTRLKNHVLDQNILHQAQIGFLPDHRTSDHIFTLRTLVDKYVNQVPRGKLYTCFVDFKKAFDSVWHDGLFYKLLQYNIGGKFYDLIKNLYSKTKCSIKISNQRTEFFDYCKGVRQGCILSPMLFNLYLNEIPFLLD